MGYTVRYTSYPNSEYIASIFRTPHPSGLRDGGDSLHHDASSHCCDRSGPESEAPIGALDIKKKLETPQERRQFGLSSYGKKIILRSGSAYPPCSDDECDVLLTGTLPSRLSSAFRAIAVHSSLAVQRVRHWVFRGVPEPLYQWVWERQKRGALHLHFAARVPIALVPKLTAEFQSEWIRILDSIGRRCRVDMYAKTRSYSHPKSKTQTDVTVLHHSPSRYLSKYIAKAESQSWHAFQPTRWYQCSRKLLFHLREQTRISERQGLTYRQARAIAEDIKSTIESATGKWWDLSNAGWAFFARQYQCKIQPEEGQIQMTNANANGKIQKPLAPAVARVRSHLKARPGIRAAMHSNLVELTREGQDVSDVEALYLIRSFISAKLVQVSRHTISPPDAALLLYLESVLIDRGGDSVYTDTFRTNLQFEYQRMHG